MKKKILIVNSNYYEKISKDLVKSAKNILLKNTIVKTINVPGVFEIPVIIAKNIKKYDGFIALGCVIKGQTPHFNYISKITMESIMNISINSKKPIGNGIITCLNFKQALARRKKGREAAMAVISLLNHL